MGEVIRVGGLCLEKIPGYNVRRDGVRAYKKTDTAEIDAWLDELKRPVDIGKGRRIIMMPAESFESLSIEGKNVVICFKA